MPPSTSVVVDGGLFNNLHVKQFLNKLVFFQLTINNQPRPKTNWNNSGSKRVISPFTRTPTTGTNPANYQMYDM
jgi:hypothetical protein